MFRLYIGECIMVILEEAKYVLGGSAMPYITCLTCNKTSYYAKDIRYKYCGYCKRFHEEFKGASYEVGSENEERQNNVKKV